MAIRQGDVLVCAGCGGRWPCLDKSVALVERMRLEAIARKVQRGEFVAGFIVCSRSSRPSTVRDR